VTPVTRHRGHRGHPQPHPHLEANVQYCVRTNFSSLAASSSLSFCSSRSAWDTSSITMHSCCRRAFSKNCCLGATMAHKAKPWRTGLKLLTRPSRVRTMQNLREGRSCRGTGVTGCNMQCLCMWTLCAVTRVRCSSRTLSPWRSRRPWGPRGSFAGTLGPGLTRGRQHAWLPSPPGLSAVTGQCKDSDQ
jgi:hypothetical protein